MSAPTLCRACGSLMPGNLHAARHTCGCLDACCDSPAAGAASVASQSSAVCYSAGLKESGAASMASSADQNPAPAPIQPMTEAEHNRFPKGRY